MKTSSLGNTVVRLLPLNSLLEVVRQNNLNPFLERWQKDLKFWAVPLNIPPFFFNSNNCALDKPHWPRYCHCAKLQYPFLKNYFVNLQ